jgi:hypothetical protein
MAVGLVLLFVVVFFHGDSFCPACVGGLVGVLIILVSLSIIKPKPARA